MVSVLQKAGKTVAMSGDGVNDVLALKKADISFAMNGATSAAKALSNTYFLTDDFWSILRYTYGRSSCY